MFTAVLASVTGAKGTLSNDVSRHGALEQEKGAPSLCLSLSLALSLSLCRLYPLSRAARTCTANARLSASLASRTDTATFQRIYTRAPGVSSAARPRE